MKLLTIALTALPFMANINFAQSQEFGSKIASIACTAITDETIEKYKTSFDVPATEWGSREVDALIHRIYKCFSNGNTVRYYTTKVNKSRDHDAERSVDVGRIATKEQDAILAANPALLEKYNSDIRNNSGSKMALAHVRSSIGNNNGLTSEQKQRLYDQIDQLMQVAELSIQTNIKTDKQQKEQAAISEREAKSSQLSQIDNFPAECKSIIKPMYLDPDFYTIQMASEFLQIDQLYAAGAKSESCQKLSNFVQKMESQRVTMMTCKDTSRDNASIAFSEDNFLQLAAQFNQLKQLAIQQQDQKRCN